MALAIHLAPRKNRMTCWERHAKYYPVVVEIHENRVTLWADVANGAHPGTQPTRVCERCQADFVAWHRFKGFGRSGCGLRWVCEKCGELRKERRHKQWNLQRKLAADFEHKYEEWRYRFTEVQLRCADEIRADCRRDRYEELIVATSNLRLGAASLYRRKSKYEEKYSGKTIRSACRFIVGQQALNRGYAALPQAARY